MLALPQVAARPVSTARTRDALVLENIPLVQKIASKIKRSQPLIDYEDLVSAGTIGLIKAIDRHDPSKSKLSTFAYPYINGEILREIRDKWQPVKIQRSHWERCSKLTKLSNSGASDMVIAAEFNIPPEELNRTRESLNILNTAPVTEELLELDSGSSGNRELEAEAIKIFTQLQPKEKEVYGFVRRSAEGLSVAEVASHLDITAPRARGYLNDLMLANFLLKTEVEGQNVYTANLSPACSTSDRLNKITGKLKEVFLVICRLKKTTTDAIAVELGISQGQAGVYCRRLDILRLIIRDGLWLRTNFEQTVIEGINKKVQQQIEVTNFLVKLEELMKLKSQVAKMEAEIIKTGGDRSKWLIDNLAVKEA